MSAQRPLTAEQRIALIEDPALVTGRPIDLVDLQADGVLIRQQALSTGRLIHCTDRELYAGAISRMLIDAADFLPILDRILRERRRQWIGG